MVFFPESGVLGFSLMHWDIPLSYQMIISELVGLSAGLSCIKDVPLNMKIIPSVKFYFLRERLSSSSGSRMTVGIKGTGEPLSLT